MTFGDKIFRGIVGGWVDAYRVATTRTDPSMCVVNTHFEPMGFWEGLGCGWMEEHVLRVERDIATSLEDAFGSNEPSAHADSDSIIFKSGGNNVASISSNGAFGLGTTTPSMQLTLTPTDQVTGVSIDEWLDATEHSILKITAPRATGR